MVERQIGPRQSAGKQFKPLFGITTYKYGQQGTNTVNPAMDALETFLQTDIEAVGVGAPNGLGSYSGIINNLGSTHKRFAVFASPLVPYANGAGAPGSLDRLVNSSLYDAAHHAGAQSLVAAGYTGPDHACRFGHEYNTQIGQVGNYPWATGFIDPYTGSPVTISLLKAAQAKVEGIYRSEGWGGIAAWSGGTSNTSALPIATAIPTHGDPALTVWDFDCYVGTRYNTTKNDYASGWQLQKNAWDAYAAYCSANGILMASSEFGATQKVPSPYFLNDAAAAQFYYDFYALAQKYSYLMAWVLKYEVNQLTSGVVDEEHCEFLSVSTTGGSPSGTGPTSEYTSPYPPGKTDLISGSGTNSLALSGSLDHSSNAGLHYVWTPSKNMLHRTDAFKKTFGGFGTTGGAAGLALPQTVPVIKTGPAIPANRSGRTRSQSTIRR